MPTLSLGTVPMAACQVLPDGTVAAANVPFTALVGCPVGRRFTDLLADDRGDRWWAGLKQCGGGPPTEISLRCRDGGSVVVAVAASPCQGGWLVLAHDVSAYKRQLETAARQKEAVERAAKARMRFFAAASHDLRQPLQALALFISVLDSHVGKAGVPVLTSAKTSLRAMEEMFDALLDMSRLDAGILQPCPTVFMINDILERMEDEFAAQAAAGGLALRVVPSSAAVRSDLAMLTRIVRNFMSNAIRYTRQGRIVLGCRRRGPVLRIEVWDTGPGISEEQREQIFEEFYQGPGAAAGTRPGIGLGLAIVQRLAAVLDHRLDIHSTPGRGSVFSVDVPVARDDEVAMGDGASRGDTAPPDLSGLTAVVVDDDPDVLTGLRLLLEEWGCHSVAAPGAEEAVRKLSEQDVGVGVILADLRLGGNLCGIAAIKKILAHLPQKVPAFLFSGDTDAASLREVAAEGYPLLRKPIDPARLGAVLAEALGRRR